jgi:hypothetical protein
MVIASLMILAACAGGEGGTTTTASSSPVSLGATSLTVLIPVAVSTAVQAVSVAPGFSSTGSLNTARYHHTASLLGNGMVLIAGGYNPAGSGSYPLNGELYNPATGVLANTGSLITPRHYHTATLLNNGMVLMAGGLGSRGALASAELYNPATQTFTPTGSLNTARAYHTATLLNDGQVLIAGGSNSARGYPTYLTTAELYNPVTGTFSYTTRTLKVARAHHTATLLSNGLVLVAGGFDGNLSSDYLASAELYNPATGTFTLAGSMKIARQLHTATLLNNGLVLIAGGNLGSLLSGLLDRAELYNPAAGTFTLTGSLETARASHTATLLNNGMVLIAGGDGSGKVDLAGAEMYNPATRTFAPAGDLRTGRANHTATLLNNGMVLIAGGTHDNDDDATASAELYNPVGRAPAVQTKRLPPPIQMCAALPGNTPKLPGKLEIVVGPSQRVAQSCSAFWNYSAAFILAQHPQHAITHLRPITTFRTAE